MASDSNRESGSSGSSRPLRVLMVAPTSFFGDYGGHIRILEESRGLQARGHDVSIVTYYKGQDVPGLKIERTARLPWRAEYEVGSSRHKLAFDLFLTHKVLQVGLKLRPHVIHGHMHEGGLLGGLLARLLRVPLILDFQGSLTGEMLDHEFIAPDGAAYRFWRWVEQKICDLPDAILTSSLKAQRLLCEEFNVAEERIVPLPDCADLDHFSPQCISANEKSALRQRFNIPADRPIVAYLGLLADYQGTSHLIQAAQHLKEQGQDVHFLIMGYPNEEYYAAMVRRLGLTDYVTLTGRVDYIRQAPSFLALGDVAVSPKTSSSEGSGKVLNYMALAQPVVAYDSEVHREYLGEWGVYVNSGNVSALAEEIMNLLQNPQRRRRLGQGLRQRAATHFSWEAATVRIENLYRRLLQQQNSIRTLDSV